MATSNNNQDAFYEGDFIDEGSFLVLTPGDLAELRGASTIVRNTQTVSSGQESLNVTSTYLDPTPYHGVPTEVALASKEVSSEPSGNPNGGASQSSTLSEPISSYFQNSSLQNYHSAVAAGPSSARNNSDANVSDSNGQNNNDNRDLSLSTVLSSIGSVSSETNSLEEAVQLVTTLKKENDELKETLAQRNEVMRNALKSLNTSVMTVEGKHADQLKKYEDCKKAIAELREENEKLKAELSANSIFSNKVGENSQSVEDRISKKDAEINCLAKKVEEYTVAIKNLQEQLAGLKDQQKIVQSELVESAKQKNQIQFDLENATITITKLTEERNRAVEHCELAKQIPNQRIEVNKNTIEADHLKVALGEARLHMTKQKESIEDRDKVISALQLRVAKLLQDNEQKMFFEAQMKEFEANFMEERNDKNKLAEELSVLKIDLEKKTAELEKLHRTHLILANEHLNKNSANPMSEGFVVVSRQNSAQNPSVGQSQAASTPQPTAPSVSTQANCVNSGLSSTNAENHQGLQPCPLCGKRFATSNALVHHAANCGMDPNIRPRTDPFIL